MPELKKGIRIFSENELDLYTDCRILALKLDKNILVKELDELFDNFDLNEVELKIIKQKLKNEQYFVKHKM